MSPLGRNYCRWEPSDAFPFRKRTCLPFNTITCHATSHCNVHATYHSLHLPPRATLQRYQDASITCHQMSHWWCACHTSSHCNVPFPAPATQSHAPTLPGRFNRLRLPPNVTLVLRQPHNVTLQRTLPCTSHPVTRCNWKCHMYKRSNFTCTSEPISRVQANPRPIYPRFPCISSHSCKFFSSTPLRQNRPRPNSILLFILTPRKNEQPQRKKNHPKNENHLPSTTIIVIQTCDLFGMVSLYVTLTSWRSPRLESSPWSRYRTEARQDVGSHTTTSTSDDPCSVLRTEGVELIGCPNRCFSMELCHGNLRIPPPLNANPPPKK